MDMQSAFTSQQIEALDQPLDHRLISTRKGSNNTTFKYIEGHDVIDQANRIFGFGNWAYRPLSCEQKVIYDPITGEAAGVSYTALVELTVRGCVAPIVEKGVQPVASWNVTDVVMSKRKRDEDKQRPIEQWEQANAMRVIVESHEVAEKGAMTDGLKRALRTFGAQFGNSLYGDTRVEQQPASARSRQQAIPQQLPAISVKIENLRQSALKRGLIGQSPEDWQAFKFAQLGVSSHDDSLSPDQYDRLLDALRGYQKVS